MARRRPAFVHGLTPCDTKSGDMTLGGREGDPGSTIRCSLVPVRSHDRSVSCSASDSTIGGCGLPHVEGVHHAALLRGYVLGTKEQG